MKLLKSLCKEELTMADHHTLSLKSTKAMKGKKSNFQTGFN